MQVTDMTGSTVANFVLHYRLDGVTRFKEFDSRSAAVNWENKRAPEWGDRYKFLKLDRIK